MDIQVGDILTMKKEHPCGSKQWEVRARGRISACAAALRA